MSCVGTDAQVDRRDIAAMGLKRCRGGQPLYDDLLGRGHPVIAVFNIQARKLARIARGVFKSGKDFDPVLLRVGQACFQQACLRTSGLDST